MFPKDTSIGNISIYLRPLSQRNELNHSLALCSLENRIVGYLGALNRKNRLPKDRVKPLFINIAAAFRQLVTSFETK